jgi:hypothetical protein
MLVSLPQRFLIAIAVASSLLVAAGCGKRGPERLPVYGSVTWKGQPVPAGVVYLMPDANKGGSGPSGFALIKNGQYDSNDEKSKGCLAGPHIATIQGCTGEGISGSYPYGAPLFTQCEIAIDIPPEGGQLDIVIPDSTPAAPRVDTSLE